MASSRIQKIIEHAKKFGFLNNSLTARVHKKCLAIEDASAVPISEESSDDLKITVNDYGPFGSQMRKNVLDVWWKYSVTLQDNIFPLYVPCIDQASTVKVNGQSSLPYRIRAENNYESFAKHLSNSEVGIAQIMALPFVNNTTPNSFLLMRYDFTNH